MLQLYKEPKPISLEDIVGEPLTSFLVTGILNPFGPTLTTAAVVGNLEPGQTLPIVYLMLNPFRQEIAEVGQALIGSINECPLDNPQPLFGLPFGSCPSLVLASLYLKPEDATAVYAAFLRRFNDARTLFDRIRRHPGDPWNRVQKEMDAALHNLQTAVLSGQLRNSMAELSSQSLTGGEAAQNEILMMRSFLDEISAIAKNAEKPLTEDEAFEFATLLLSEKHFLPELQAFFHAWNGSVESQKKGGSASLSHGAMTLESFEKWFWVIAKSCRVPTPRPEGHGAEPSDQAAALRQHPEAHQSRPNEVRCWVCKEPLGVTDTNRGKKVKCPRCGAKQKLPKY